MCPSLALATLLLAVPLVGALAQPANPAKRNPAVQRDRPVQRRDLLDQSGA